MSLGGGCAAAFGSERCDWSLSSVRSHLAALGGPTEEELLELLDQCDLALTRTPDSTPRASTCRYTLGRGAATSLASASAFTCLGLRS